MSLNNYNYMKMLCSKLSRNQIIEDLAVKCEELYLAREGILKKDTEIERLHSIIKEVREYIEEQKYPFCDGYDFREEDAIKILSILDKENKDGER